MMMGFSLPQMVLFGILIMFILTEKVSINMGEGMTRRGNISQVRDGTMN
jgi:hypothetical protein